MSLLEKINSPGDVKKIPPAELPQLAREIREQIVEVVSRHGGHLASNLGVVELAISLHYLFDPPYDKIVWDTGNQTYPHKLLTGRREGFHTLRLDGGISGFARKEESPYDLFSWGHAGTSISAALGLVEARDLSSEDYQVVAVIGDGSMTVGMVYEGLNHAGFLAKDMIVILNDNEMSISRNVGAISSYLNRLITGQWYNRVRGEIESLVRAIPRIGDHILTMSKKAEESVKGLLTPGLLFEELGFRYVGPIDGHRFEHLLPTLENVKRLKGPTLVHVITKKGKGYAPAERDPVTLHAPPPFQKETGEIIKKAHHPTYTQVCVDALIRMARRNQRIVGITAAMAEGTGLVHFAREFPSRFYDVGICEQHAVSFAAGLATGGLRPVVAIYSTFLQRAYDQLIHDVSLQNLPVTFCIDRAGIVGEDGQTHHGTFDFAYTRSLPNMVVMAPKDENELQQMLCTALGYPGPASIRYPRGEGIGVALEEELSPIPIGKAELLTEGKEIVLLAIGSMVYPALSAAALLREKGISAAVVNARFVKPLDREMIIQLVTQVRKIVTLEEHMLAGGFGSAVAELLEAEGLSGYRLLRIGLPDVFIEHGPQNILRRRYGLDAEGIAVRVEKFVAEGPAEKLIR